MAARLIGRRHPLQVPAIEPDAVQVSLGCVPGRGVKIDHLVRVNGGFNPDDIELALSQRNLDLLVQDIDGDGLNEVLVNGDESGRGLPCGKRPFERARKWDADRGNELQVPIDRVPGAAHLRDLIVKKARPFPRIREPHQPSATTESPDERAAQQSLKIQNL